MSKGKGFHLRIGGNHPRLCHVWDIVRISDTGHHLTLGGFPRHRRGGGENFVFLPYQLLKSFAFKTNCSMMKPFFK